MKLSGSRILSAVLAAVMAFSVSACSGGTGASSAAAQSQNAAAASSAAASKYPAYLNLDSYHPIVKSGNTETVSFMIFVGSDYTSDPMERYYWKLMEKVLNIKCDVTQSSDSQAADSIPVMFASDTLKDVTIGAKLTATQQVLYGATEHQLLDLSKYMDSTLTPALSEIFSKYSEVKTGITCSDGAIYTYPYVMDLKAASLYNKRNIRKSWLDEIGKSMPSTLDELTADLYAFKAKHSDSVPLGGSFAYANPSCVLFNTLGLVTSDARGETPAYSNGNIVIPAGDKASYTEYLTLMNKYYNDGIIDRDFYTKDKVGVSADATAGKYGVIAGLDPFVLCPDVSMFQQYTALAAMTSDVNSKLFAVRSSYYSCGGCWVSAKTAHPELIARWADWMCTSEGTNCAWVGACKYNSELMLDGYSGWYLNDKYSRVDVDRVDVAGGTEKWPNSVVYLRGKIAGFDMGNLGTVIGENLYREKESKLPELDYYEQYAKSPENGDFYWRTSAMDQFEKIAVTEPSTLVYFDEKTSDRVAELASVINPYIEKETAKFVTGARPLSEISNYFSELDKLGFQEYLGYYQKAYKKA